MLDRFLKWLARPGEPWIERGELTAMDVTFRAVRIRTLGVWILHPNDGWRKIRAKWIELLFKPTTK